MRSEFIERREQERRQAANAAIAHHFAECRRAVANRRRSDSQFVSDWLAKFDAARTA